MKKVIFAFLLLSVSVWVVGAQNDNRKTNPAGGRGGEKDLALFANSLSAAIASIGATETVLNCADAVTVSEDLKIPKNIKFKPTGECAVNVAAGKTLTIGAMVNPGNAKIFNSASPGATVVFEKGAVEAYNIAWWVGTGDGTDATDAITEANASSVKNQGGRIRFPPARYTTTGGHILGDSTIIEGEGNFPNANYGGTNLKLANSKADYMFKIGEGEWGIRFRDIVLDGTGTTGKTGVLLEGNPPNTSGDLAFSFVSFIAFENGVYHHSLGRDWQFAQIKFDHCFFQFNKTAIRMNSVNGQFFVNSSYFSIPPNGWAFDARNSGPLTVIASEFGGTWGSGVSGDCGVVRYTGQHREFNFINTQDESCKIFMQNDASDITSITNIIGSLVQGKLQLNQSCTINSYGSTYLSHAFQDAPGVGSHITSRGDFVREVSVVDGVTPVKPARLDKFVGGSYIAVEENASSLEIKYRTPARFLTPKIWDGYATTPQVAVGHFSQIAESKILLRLGRVDAAEKFDFYYDFWRQNFGDDAGRLKIRGNQTGYAGYDLENGDLYVQGAVRGQSVALADGAAITVDSRAGNNFFVTLGGNRTLQMAALAPFDQKRADGQTITFEIRQDARGGRTLSLSTAAGQFSFGSDIPALTLSTAGGKTDLLTVQYSARMNKWLVKDLKKGF